MDTIEFEGMRAYEYKGIRAVLPSRWTDQQREAWFEQALKDGHLRRPLRVLKKNGSAQVMRAWRLNNGER